MRIDEKRVGQTPMVFRFKDYGQRRVTLYKDGYLSQSHVLDLEPRWYSTFPIDLVTEVLLPFGWKDVREYHWTLMPGIGVIPTPDLESVLGRAEDLRRAGPEGPRARRAKPPAADGEVRP